MLLRFRTFGTDRRVRSMKVVCGYDPGEPHRAWFAGWADDGAQVVVSPEENVAKFASDLRVAEVLLHILRPVTEEVLAGAPRLGLVEETALVDALTSGRLRAAGLDVLAEEPPPPDHPLLSLDNVVLTPHVAWLTQETLARSFDVALENVRRLRDGRDLLFRVA
jgi:phosphoglycerate dehydrogenase-like enzyme